MNTRSILTLLTAIVLTFAVVGPAYAYDPFEQTNAWLQTKSLNWKVVEQRYVAILHSPNDGARISAANYIGEYRLDHAVAALTDILVKDANECARCAAALALVQMKTDEATDVLVKAITHNDNPNVAQFCRSLVFARGDFSKLPIEFAAER